MGNQPTKHTGKPKKAVHWKSAEPPSPPGKPMLVPGSPSTTAPDVVTLRWKRPTSDGGSPILGYIVEHRRTGSPHWVRATAQLIHATELSLSGLEPGWRYQFRITAQNIVGQSDCSELSDPLTVTLQRAAIAPPRFVQELYDTTAIENEKMEFRVSVAGSPAPQISWYKDGFEIFSSRRTRIITEGDLSILIIHQVALTDEGEFKCTATNRAGHAITICSLSIDAYPKIRLPRQYEEGLIVEADEVIRLKVGVAGQPIPIVEWSHNGELIPNEGRYEIETNDKNSSLRIANAERSDRGEYNLRAFNKLGEDYASFLVTVTAKPEPPSRIQITFGLGKTIILSWSAPEDDGGCKIGNYIVEYYRVGWDVWLKATTCRQLTTTLSGLFEGSQYRFRVKAENPYGLSEPSEESDTLFIPDLKRGINSATQIPEPGENAPNPPTLPRKRREVSHSPPREAEQIKKVKAFTPETYSRDEIVREMSYGTRDEDFYRPKQPTEPLPKPPAVIITEPAPSPIREPAPPPPKSPSPKPQRPQSFASPLKAMEKFSKEASPLFKRPSPSPSPTENQLSPQQQQHQQPTSPTDAATSPTIHNSSEFMLVLYNEQEAKNNTRNSTFDFELEDLAAPPPPLSLSAPELNVEPPPAPGMRPAVSSTELLYERAMARFYQAVALEETENQRKAAERRRSMSAAEPTQPQLQPQETSAATNRLSDRRSSLRRRLSGDKEAIVKQSSFESQHSSAVDDVIPEEKEEIMKEEEMVEEAREATDALGKLVDLDEELSISSSMDSMLEELKRRESARSSRSRIMSDDEEMETYHPGQRTISPYRNPDPSQAIEVLTKPLPMPDPNFVPKPILKRPSTEILTKDEKEKKVAPSKPERRSLTNIFDRKSPTKEERKPSPIRSPTPPVVEKEKTPEVEVKQPAAPEPAEIISEKQPPSGQEINTAIRSEVARQRKLESRQSSIEESKAVADFYSDIVQQVETAKKPRPLPLYMNPDEVRKLNERGRSREASFERSQGSRAESTSPMPPEEIYRVQKSRSPSLSSEQIVTKGKPARESRILKQRSASIENDGSRPSSAMKEHPPSPQTRPDTAFRPSGANDEPTRRSRPTRESAAIAKKRNVSQTRSRSSSGVREGANAPEKTPMDVARRARLRSATSPQKSTAVESAPELPKPPSTPSVPPSPSIPPTPSVQSTPSTPTEQPSLHEPRSRSQSTAPDPAPEDTSYQSTVSYLTDVALFALACWLYFFKNPKLAIPIIVLIMYRHISDAVRHRLPPWMKRSLS
ncbi:serine/arginine repetitive matrix protein 1 isoform X2 [Armigeres subalbatus]|uniref:serine/arginine repetitive matrix protein 1 isoform X2 n=1 Tax=Armigeres subalbatus TaxID=124917 RepID=UPI002ED067E9